jgi:hypothetical protein
MKTLNHKYIKMKTIKLILLLAGISWTMNTIAQSQHALSFDGVNDYVNCGTDASLNITGPITVEVWLYFTTAQLQYKRFVVKEWETSYNLGVGAATNSVLFGMAPNGNINNTLQTGTVLTAGAWNHVAGTWDGDTLRIFVNGEPMAKKAWVNNSVAGSAFPTILGSDQVYNSLRFYQGKMDEVRIWNVARTMQEIRDNMYKELDNPSMEVSLMAYYRFNEGSGQISADLSQNGNTAILGGTVNPETSDPAWEVSYAPIPYYTVADGSWNINTTWAPTQTKPVKSWARAWINHSVTIPSSVQMHEIQIHPLAGLELITGFNLTVNELLSVHGTGIFTMNQNCVLTMGSGSAIMVEDQGLFESFGSPGNEAMISGTGYYSFDVNEGGTLSAVSAIFEYMDISGLNIAGEVDPSFTMDNCTFRNGQTGGSLITFSGTEPATLTNVLFPANTWGGSYNVSKINDTGNIEFVDATGEFAGPGYEFDPYDLIEWGEFSLEIKIYLEGAFTGTEMESGLNQLLPLTQPFNNAPWNYNGTENVPSIPGADIVDWILVELRDAPDGISATPATIVDIQAAFITNLGEIVDLDGINPIRFGSTISDGLFVVIWHRNHLGVMSAFPLINVSGVYSYDFTGAGSQVYGDGSGYTEISTGIWAMVTGDANADGIIDADDMVLSWNDESGKAGYLQSDINLDGQSNNLDKNEYWFPNLGKFSQVPD